MSTETTVTGTPTYLNFISPSFAIRGRGICHSRLSSKESFIIPLVYWDIEGHMPVTNPVTGVARTAREKVYAIIYSMSYEVHPTWIDGEHAIFTGSLAECQQFCFRNLAVFNLLTTNYPFRLVIGENIEANP